MRAIAVLIHFFRNGIEVRPKTESDQWWSWLEFSMDAWIVDRVAAGEVAELFEGLGWTPCDVPIVADAWPAWGWNGDAVTARLIARDPGCRVVAVDGAFRRELVLTVARRAPLEHVLWCFRDDDTLCIAFALCDARSRVRRIELDMRCPDAMGIERLKMLARDAFVQPGERDPAVATAAHLVEVLDAEGLTREFFAGFRAQLEQLIESIECGPPLPEDRWNSALIVLLRLVFVYFLQHEGMLDGDRRYVARRLRKALTDGRDDFWESTLRPLFFGVLNTPAGARDRLAQQLGEIPFLNGGLFEPTPLELRHPAMRWTTGALADVVELFERFHFTAAEPIGDDEARVVDPEMLGKVFEGLMYGDERKASGSFYTPRDVVRDMVETTIDNFVDDCAADGVDADAALESVRILDPAVGTGAFLLEAFASLRRRRAERGLPVDYPALRTLVHQHLFGVDRNRTAVRLCELRLWLAMLSAMRNATTIDPLPNLSHRIVAGDSLLDGVDLIRQRAGALHPGALVGVMQVERELEAAQREFLEAHGADKIRVRREIVRIERELQLQLIAGRRRLLERRLDPLTAVQRSDDLFGGSMSTAEQDEAVRQLECEIAALDEREVEVVDGRGEVGGFSYETRFGAAAREGFDIIVTNPPWVRAQRVERRKRDLLATCYSTAGSVLWAGARELGIRAPYGTQPDLAALFVERSLELLRPGGRLAALIPAKLFRALHASPMRRLLERHQVERIEDLSDADRQLFDATVYPGILHVRKSAPKRGSIDVRVWRGERCARFRRAPEALTLSGRPGEPWALVPGGVHALLTRVRRAFPALGADPALAPRRGVFSGANSVFVRPRGGFEELLGDSVRPFVRPLVTGSGLGETPASEILWCYDEDGTLFEQLPAPLEQHFEQHRVALERRSDYRDGPIWQLFRVRADTCAPKVAWRDMSVLLEPVLVGEGPVAANTVYYVPFEQAEAAAGFARWMRTPVVRACAYAIAEHARGGWRRHFAWVVRMLPIPALHFDWATFDERVFGCSAHELELLAEWLGAAQEAA